MIQVKMIQNLFSLSKKNEVMLFISHANDSKYEDTFLLGPDLIGQLKLKRKIMLNHWTDIEGYMATPFK